jgi:hypothetical protein
MEHQKTQAICLEVEAGNSPLERNEIEPHNNAARIAGEVTGGSVAVSDGSAYCAHGKKKARCKECGVSA